MSELTPRVDAWRRRSAEAEFRGRTIRLWQREGEGPLLLFLHGFPSSSFDWRYVWEETEGRAALAFDFLGFGLSDKPRGHDYSLLGQADLAEELVRSHPASGRPVFVVAHDMGTSVANELMARDIDGDLGFEVAGVLLFNGSMVQSAAKPVLGQRLLRGRLGPLAAHFSSPRFFRSQFATVFSAKHPLSREEAADQWALITHNGGQRIGHRTIAYMDERELRAERWHGAIRDWAGHLELGWGMVDPVARPAVLRAVRGLRPRAPVTEWPELGHYPQIEDPAAVFELIEGALGAAR
ncbi:MAG: alpha/beta fold hydrolase [Solirubrobacterales bacterium]